MAIVMRLSWLVLPIAAFLILHKLIAPGPVGGSGCMIGKTLEGW
jgi:hypothetical protein